MVSRTANPDDAAFELSPCVQCQQNTYPLNAAACTQCPPNTGTGSTGAGSIDECRGTVSNGV